MKPKHELQRMLVAAIGVWDFWSYVPEYDHAIAEIRMHLDCDKDTADALLKAMQKQYPGLRVLMPDA